MLYSHKNKKTHGSKYKIAIILSHFNDSVTSRLLRGCLKALKERKVKEKNIAIMDVPGSFELPWGAQRMAKTKKYDAIICLGAIIKGETKHDEYVARACSHGIMSVSLAYDIPILFGVLTTPNVKLAKARAGDNKRNKGYECGMAAVEMARVGLDSLR